MWMEGSEQKSSLFPLGKRQSVNGAARRGDFLRISLSLSGIGGVLPALTSSLGTMAEEAAFYPYCVRKGQEIFSSKLF